MEMWFFASRRRHTRLQGNWSSDVCSSDLAVVEMGQEPAAVLEDRAGVHGGPRLVAVPQGAPPQAVKEEEVQPEGDTKDGEGGAGRSGERRVGEEGRSRWSADHLKKKEWRCGFLQAEDGIRDYKVTGVQTCALPIWPSWRWGRSQRPSSRTERAFMAARASWLFHRSRRPRP